MAHWAPPRFAGASVTRSATLEPGLATFDGGFDANGAARSAMVCAISRDPRERGRRVVGYFLDQSDRPRRRRILAGEVADQLEFLIKAEDFVRRSGVPHRPR